MLHERFIILRIFTNLLTKKGKKTVAERLMLNAFRILRSKYKINSPSTYVLNLLDKLKPVLGVTSKQVGSMRVKLPKRLTQRQKYFKIMRWLVIGAKKRSNSGYLTSLNLAKELFETGLESKFTITKKLIREHKNALHDTRPFLRYLNK